MHVIIGGKFQGKRAYAERLYGKFRHVSDLELSDTIIPGLVVNVHMGVKRGLGCDYFAERISVLRKCVIICTEICGGIVPIDEASRRWRDETGRLYQTLAREAEIVDRVFAGLALRLKGE
ncbi:MAG: bifunctional adenosylcobinamide kinase/adenosylcobinamide-phosphate guanylyltransferase [Synergistaceae bacterium]|nr:bifunctional adenosylcobinamide kinase/adenosylcobinamide-phosphate guanylyltransferase [Synergistaceae bacterium]